MKMDASKYKSVPVKSSEITPEHLFLNRREFMKLAGLTGVGALLAACGATEETQTANDTPNPTVEVEEGGTVVVTEELSDPLNTYEEITNYNNFYEFSMDKEAVASLSKDFKATPWQVEVGGLVQNPKTYGLEDLLNGFTQQERIYRLRCVEGWSMVIPWLGFPLAELLKQVEPMGNAQYVRFETILDPEQLPGQKSQWFPWPYQEGLRLDEAMNDLAILATGLYGKSMPNQNGAPIRLVVPWKYGFKSIKSIVKIELVEEMPATLWSTVAPSEYGFYANVNPKVPHPRWSQASERRIGELSRRETLMFNGYAEEVAYLYEGMDLAENY